MSSKKTEALLTEISNKLSTLTRLFTINLVKDIKKQKDQIAVLNEVGFKPKQIADILSTTSNTVSVTLNELKKEGSAKERKETSKKEDIKPIEVEVKPEEQK